MSLAKKAVLFSPGSISKDQKIAEFEKELLEACNETGVGPMGLGGDTSVIGLRVLYAARHPASLPVGLVFQCWAARQASALIKSDLSVEYYSYPKFTKELSK